MSKQAEDSKTVDMIGDLPKRRGRPPAIVGLTPEQRKEQNKVDAARRKAKSRAAKSDTHGQLTVSLPLDLLEQFRDFLKFKDVKQDDVIEKLLRGQLLRKR